ncbi:methyl-CpG-binding domain-containing protein 13-like isoform X2 [Andrographis paniculata]|nr:methyl-CpG-binding domain-containing protein 13-like isoform X2 [Andrographis paniculata]
MEEKIRKGGSLKGKPYKVYTDLSSGTKFYSKPEVLRYLNSVDHSANTTSQNKVENVVEPPQCVSQADTGSTSKHKRKSCSFKMVATEIAADEDLPSGWIKKIRTSQSGGRVRKDPFYIDPASGYGFRSKKDALRYLKTNDIASCACRPLKMDLDLKATTNEIHSSNPATDKLSNQKKDHIRREESKPNDGAEADTKILKKTQDSLVLDHVKVTSDGIDSFRENIFIENSIKNAKMENDCRPIIEAAKEDLRITDVIDSSLAEQQPSENRVDSRADRTRQGSRKSKKGEASSLPLRASKRLAKSEPEVLPSPCLSERSLRAAARKSSGSIKVDPSPEESTSIPLPPDTELAKKEKVDAESPPVRTETLEPMEKPSSAIPDDPINGNITEKQPDSGKLLSQEPLFLYDFGESWSDPLEFAFKTLRGEISIEDLNLTACFTKSISPPSNQPEAPVNLQNVFHPVPRPYNQAEGTLKPSQSNAAMNFPIDFLPQAESFKQQNSQFPSSPHPPSAGQSNTGFATCSGFNSQSNMKAANPTDFNR